MKKIIYSGIGLLLAAALLTACGNTDNIDSPVPETPAETGTEAVTDPNNIVVYAPDQTPDYVRKNSYPDEPVGYLKDHITGTGSLGTDYPLLSAYGPRDTVNGQISGFHRGLDFAMDEGTQLIAPDKCVVKYTGYNDQRGIWLVLYWGNGYYIGLQHLSRLFVKEGDVVLKGRVIALSGDTGASLTPHLHLDIIQNDTGYDTLTDFNDDNLRVNPYYFVFGMQEVEISERDYY